MSTRTFTPDVETVNADGHRVTTMHLKQACNGCGHLLGDATDEEVDRAIAGTRALDVRAECPNCAPVVELEKTGCRTWQLTARNFLTVDCDLDNLNVFAKGFTETDDEGALQTIGLRIGIRPNHVVALFGDWIIRHPDGRFTVHAGPTAGEQR